MRVLLYALAQVKRNTKEEHGVEEEQEGEKGQEGEPDGPGLWHRWQKNRYDVFMRMARVCQADGEAIAARRISEEKHEIVAPLARREARPDLFSITFLRLRSGYSRFPTRLPLVSHSRLPSSAPLPLPSLILSPVRLHLAIKSDLTSIYLRIYPVSAAAALLSLFSLPLPLSSVLGRFTPHRGRRHADA